MCVCVCVFLSLSPIHQNDQDLFDDQVQPFLYFSNSTKQKHATNNKQTNDPKFVEFYKTKTCNKQQTNDPKFVAFSKYKTYHVGSFVA
jgi:hypothetical protein